MMPDKLPRKLSVHHTGVGGASASKKAFNGLLPSEWAGLIKSHVGATAFPEVFSVVVDGEDADFLL